jgi:hypothetical protein
MDTMKQMLVEQKEDDKKERQAKEEADQRNKEIEDAKREKEDAHDRAMAKLQDELEHIRKIKATEVVADLIRRNIKKVNGVQLQDYQSGKLEIDYDSVMSYYQDLIKKEKEAFDVEKQRRHREIQIWSRALKEEQKRQIEKFCEDKGAEEMAQILEAIKQRHERESGLKNAMASSYSSMKAFKDRQMEIRKEKHQQATNTFMDEKAREVQNDIIRQAKKELVLENNRKIQREKERKTHEELMAKRKDEQAGEDDEESKGWMKGQIKQQPTYDRPARGDGDDGGFIKRGTGARKEETAPSSAEKRPPMFRNTGKKEEDTGFTINRGLARKEEPEAAAPPV